MTCLNAILIVALIIFTFVSCYSGINTGEVTQLKSGGECDGFRVPAAISPGCLTQSSSPIGLGYRRYASTHPRKCIANGSPQGSHLNPPSNGASAPAQTPRMRAPLNFSIKAVHATPRGSLFGKPLVESHLRPPHWSWALPSASYKLIKNITSLLFLSTELGRCPRGRH